LKNQKITYMKKIYAVLVILFVYSGMTAWSQTEINTFNSVGCGYSTTLLSDYQCIGINPANLGWSWDDHTVHFSFLESGFNIYTNALTKSQLSNDLFNNSFELDYEGQLKAAQSFTNTRMWGQAGITWLGISFNNEKAGGFAFTIRDRLLWNTVLDSAAAQFTFLGYHAPYFDSLAVNNGDTSGYSTNPSLASSVYGSTKAHFIWYREYAFAYGRKIFGNKNFTLYGGITARYIAGYATAKYQADGDNIDAYSALGPEFQVDYGVSTPSEIGGSGIKKVGSGYSIDIGVTVEILKKIKAGVAIIDIGQIKWNGNVYQAKNINVYKISTPGITNYNIFQQGQLINVDGLPSEGDLYYGVPSKTVRMPTQLRLGGSWRIIQPVEVGLDVDMPFNKNLPGSYDKAILGVGGRYMPAKWIEVQLGLVTGADVGTNWPIGVVFYPVRNQNTAWTMGIATRDISTLWRQEDIMASVVSGFFRISLGSLKK
jgi:hypothetical protein